jgi:hypothetical protein
MSSWVTHSFTQTRHSEWNYASTMSPLCHPGRHLANQHDGLVHHVYIYKGVAGFWKGVSFSRKFIFQEPYLRVTRWRVPSVDPLVTLPRCPASLDASQPDSRMALLTLQHHCTSQSISPFDSWIQTAHTFNKSAGRSFGPRSLNCVHK